MHYDVYLDCSVTGELPFAYEVEAENAQEASRSVIELADQECAVHGKHTVVCVLPSGPEDDE